MLNPNEKEFYLSVNVSGCVQGRFIAKNLEDAKEQMQELLSDADFGPLQDIDWDDPSEY